MKKVITLLLLIISILAISITAYAGYGECKRCSCYGYSDRGDMVCECGHGYGSHRA
mgnify:CR=1 FL=1|jgi:hypothetical protein